MGGRETGEGREKKKKTEKSTQCARAAPLIWLTSCHVQDSGGGGRAAETPVALGSVLE